MTHESVVAENRMLQGCKGLIRIAAALIVGLLVANQNALAQGNKPKIIHDAEYYVLEVQNGQKWDAEDKNLDQRLTDLRKKYRTPPNIIHVMWDDTPVGEVGVPFIQKQRGWETPNINRFAAEGINFTRMYSEPSCTQTRSAFLTGRLPVRTGMYKVGFPYEYGGLPPLRSDAGRFALESGLRHGVLRQGAYRRH